MNDDLEHKIQVVIGLFIFSCLGAALFYGPIMITVCLIGLAIVGVLLKAIGR